MGKQPAVIQAAPYDPAYLLDPSNAPTSTYLRDKWVPIGSAIAGFLVPLIRNVSYRRPLMSGLPLYAACTVGGGVFGYLWHWKSERYWAEQDAILRHYVQLHPEDFKPTERVLIGDMMKPWYPAR